MARAGTPLLDFQAIPSLLKACAGLACGKQGAAVHAGVLKGGFESCTSIANSIMSFYSKRGRVDDAWSQFGHMAQRDSVSWNVMIHGFLSHGADDDGLGLFVEARAATFQPNLSTVVLVLQSCWRRGALLECLSLHGLLAKDGTLAQLPVQNSLLNGYARSRDMVSAHKLFNEIPHRDVISWSVIISGYARNGAAVDALCLFRDMYVGGRAEPDGLTLVSALQACSYLENLRPGRMIHAYVISKGFQSDVFVGNSLVDMYSKCLDIDSAYKTFMEITQRNIISWNSMLSGLVYNEWYSEALELLDLMNREGIRPDEVTLVNVLQSCRRLEQGFLCMCIHGMILRRCFQSNMILLNTLLDAYAKCGVVNLAVKLFGLMDSRNLISWSTMIMAYNYFGMPDEAIALFREMMLANVRPNSVTMLAILQACSPLQEMRILNTVHGIAIRNSLAKELTVGTALLDMYAKCGEINSSVKVFREMPEKNTISWSAMINAHGINGQAREALSLLHEMKLENIEPNRVTLLSLLSACGHGGLVDEGFSCFKDMCDNYLVDPSPEHYSCLVDMLGRAGDLTGALEVVKKVPEGVDVSSSAWGALLSACKNFKNSQIGEQAFSHVMRLEGLKASTYILASNMYAMDDLRGNVAMMRSLIRKMHLKVMAGFSSVHVDKKVHRFVSGDNSYPYSEEIQTTVKHLHLYMRSDEDFTCCL